MIERDRSLALATLGAVAAIVVPLTTAGLGYLAGSRATNKEYVSLAVNIINDPKSAKPIRSWAVKVFSEMSPVYVDSGVKSALETSPFVFISNPKAERILLKNSFLVPRNLLSFNFAKACVHPESVGNKTGGNFNQALIDAYADCAAKNETLRNYLADLEKTSASELAE